MYLELVLEVTAQVLCHLVALRGNTTHTEVNACTQFLYFDWDCLGWIIYLHLI